MDPDKLMKKLKKSSKVRLTNKTSDAILSNRQSLLGDSGEADRTSKKFEKKYKTQLDKLKKL